MTDSLEKRIDQAVAELKATEEAVARTERELRDASIGAVSSDRAVRVTVGAQGELSDLEFLDGKYRAMAPQELAASVLEATQEARTRMGRHVMRA
ncbi:YbaB/EbfC family nucleoid-associated protein, partial [Streptomyces exfoliatus]